MRDKPTTRSSTSGKGEYSGFVILHPFLSLAAGMAGFPAYFFGENILPLSVGFIVLRAQDQSLYPGAYLSCI